MGYITDWRHNKIYYHPDNSALDQGCIQLEICLHQNPRDIVLIKGSICWMCFSWCIQSFQLSEKMCCAWLCWWCKTLVKKLFAQQDSASGVVGDCSIGQWSSNYRSTPRFFLCPLYFSLYINDFPSVPILLYWFVRRWYCYFCVWLFAEVVARIKIATTVRYKLYFSVDVSQ